MFDSLEMLLELEVAGDLELVFLQPMVLVHPLDWLLVLLPLLFPHAPSELKILWALMALCDSPNFAPFLHAFLPVTTILQPSQVVQYPNPLVIC